MLALLIYILIIVFVNIGFTVIPPIDIGFGLFAPMSIVAGAVFVARDYAQRAVGDVVLIAMVVGCAISYVMADPNVAIASAVSFAFSEFVDWVIFSVTKRPFHKRVLISSLIAAPIDTAVFLMYIDILSTPTFVLMVLSKLIVALGVYYHGKREEACGVA